jgi:hypothetical protein
MKTNLIIATLMILTACSHINPIGDGKTHLIRCHSWFKGEESCEKLADEVCSNGYKVAAKNVYFEWQKGPQRSVTIVCK